MRPTGFIARCRCGVITGAADAERTDRKQLGQLLGTWLFEGQTVEPRFGSKWRETLESCRCATPAQEGAKE